jgi:hypothetical protein
MRKQSPILPRLLLAGTAAVTLGIGASAAVSASTGTTEPADDTTAHTEAGHTMDTTAGSLAVDGSAEASSPEAEAFCAAEVAAEAAFVREDPAQIGPAVEALTAATPPDLLPTVEALLASAEAGPEDPAFVEAYAAVIDYMRANCGFAEVNVAASEYEFSGMPEELPAGPTIIALENVGEEFHEIVLLRINDDVTMPVEELVALPDEEVETMATFAGATFAPPGATAQTVVDFTPGRYVALCSLPEGATPEVMEQLEAAEGTAPERSAPVGSEPAGTEPAATEPAGTEPAGSAPEGSMPGGPEVGPPHFTLGMIQEFTVV